MFKFARNREVLWPVTIQVPADGGPESVEIKIRYRLMGRREILAHTEQIRARAQEDAEDMDALLAAMDKTLAEHITGWEGIGGEDGEVLEFSAANLAMILDQPYLREPIEAGLYAASRGALAKN